MTPKLASLVTTTKLEFLALAIIHAGAAIRDKLCSLRDYLDYYSLTSANYGAQSLRLKAPTLMLLCMQCGRFATVVLRRGALRLLLMRWIF